MKPSFLKRGSTFISSLIVLFILLSVSAQAQKVDLIVGEKQKKGLLSNNVGIVGNDADGFYMLRIKSKGMALNGINMGLKGEVYIDFYDYKMNYKGGGDLGDIMLQIKKPNKQNLEFIAQDSKKDLFVFYSMADKSKTTLYKAKLDKKKLTLEKGEKLLTVKNVGKSDRRGTFSMTYSKDHSKAGIISVLSENKKTDAVGYVAMIDTDFNKLWDKYESVPIIKARNKSIFVSVEDLSSSASVIPSRYSIKNAYQVSNDGAFYWRLPIKKSKKRSKKKPNYSYNYMKFSKDSKLQKVVVDKPEIFITGMSTNLKEDGKAEIWGFYSNPKSSSLDGVIHFEVNTQEMTISDEKKTPFTAAHKKQFIGESDSRRSKKLLKKLAKGDDVELPNFTLTDHFYWDDNSSTLVGEVFYTYTKSRRSSNGSYSYTTYYVHGNLALIHLTADKKIKKIDIVNKSMSSPSMLGGSYYVSQFDDKVVFVYNNLPSREIQYTVAGKDREPKTKVLANMKKKGELEGFILEPTMAIPVSATEAITTAFKGRKQRLIKIKFF